MSSLFKSLSLKNKVVLVTGASSGIGKATTLGFAEEGAKVIIAARTVEKLEELKQQIDEQYKVPVHVLQLDVMDIKKLVNLPNELPEEFSKVDILVNNAGLGVGGGPVDSLDVEDAGVTIDTNIKAMLATMRAFIPGMKERGYGHVINISSLAAEIMMQGAAVYNASKQAVKAICEDATKDLEKTPIRITEIRPGMVETKFFDQNERKKKESQFATPEVFQEVASLDALDVAETCVYAAKRPLEVQIKTVTILPKDPKYIP